MSKPIAIPAVSVNYAQNGKSIEPTPPHMALINRIHPFGEDYAILAKSMNG